MNPEYDVIVIGSGPSGAMAAQTLVEGGMHTAMLDVGFFDDSYATNIPNKNFTTIRNTDQQQHDYFLGHEFEGIPAGDIGTGPQLTPPRAFTSHGTTEWLPMKSQSFQPLESLAYGGLGNAWGLASYVYSKNELSEVGLDVAATQDAYTVVATRIGISGEHDDGAPYTVGDMADLQPACALEPSMTGIHAAYAKHRKEVNALGCVVGKTPLALLTKPLGKRLPTKYNDMDFWVNHGDSAYRPAVTIEALKQHKKFSYIPNTFVLTCTETQGGVEIHTLDSVTHEAKTFTCKKVLLAAGVLGTARIILRSFPQHGDTLPLLSGTYSYIPCIQPRMFGKNPGERKISYSQVSLFYDESASATPSATAMLYTYRSLQLFRLINQLPLNYADGLRLLALSIPSLVIAGVHHTERFSPKKYIRLVKNVAALSGDSLEAEYVLTPSETAKNKRQEQVIKKALRKLGCYPIKRVNPGHGASVHYGGTLPFNETGKLFTLSTHGKLAGTQHIAVADGSGFRYLPPKGPTLTFMANAHVVAQHILEQLQ